LVIIFNMGKQEITFGVTSAKYYRQLARGGRLEIPFAIVLGGWIGWMASRKAASSGAMQVNRQRDGEFVEVNGTKWTL
jgi:hypothetical protein